MGLPAGRSTDAKAFEPPLGTVVQEEGDGAVLRLRDGTVLVIPEYDCFDTGWWLPPYKVLLTTSRLYMYNLRGGQANLG